MVALWAEQDADVHPYAARWTGTDWERLGTIPSGQMLSFQMDVAIHPDDGHPWVAWNARPSTTDPTHVYVARWDGSSWQAVGAALDADPAASAIALAPSLAIDASGEATIAWQEGGLVYLRRWSGSSWEAVGGGSRERFSGNSGFDPHLALTASGFVLGWRESDGAETNVNVDRWDGAGWAVLASNVSATSGTNSLWMALATDSMGRTTVAWEEPDDAGTSQVWVRRHDRTLAPLGTGSLSAVGGDTDAGLPHVIVDGLDRPVVVFAEEASAGGLRAIRVYRHH